MIHLAGTQLRMDVGMVLFRRNMPAGHDLTVV